MTRATRGHSGRALAADRSTLAIYLSAILAAVLRVTAPFWPEAYPALLVASATLWVAAFGGFAVAYAPMLLKPPRAKG